MAACQLALDGIEFEENYKPEIILKGAFGEADLAKFEIEVNKDFKIKKKFLVRQLETEIDEHFQL